MLLNPKNFERKTAICIGRGIMSQGKEWQDVIGE